MFYEEIDKLYQRVIIRNEKLYNTYPNTTHNYNILKMLKTDIDKEIEQNNIFLSEYKDIAFKYKGDIEISKEDYEVKVQRGFKNRLFKCITQDNITIRINSENAISSFLWTYDEILKYIEKSKDKNSIITQRNKLNELHNKLQQKEYRVHRSTGITYKAIIKNKDFETIDKFNIPKYSGLLILKSDNVKVEESSNINRKKRSDKKVPKLTLISQIADIAQKILIY